MNFKSVLMVCCAIASVVLAAVGAAGCGGRPRLAEVQGSVMIKGKPADGCLLICSPENGGPTSTARVEDGRFSLQMPCGQWRCFLAEPDGPPGKSKTANKLLAAVPEAYRSRSNTPWVQVVRPGANSFELTVD